jgi:plasmid stabilization system protein ParE
LTQIRWSRRASAEFDAIFEYLATESRSAAISQGRLILTAIGQLETFPASGRSGQVALTRELVIPGTPYIAYYREGDADIKLLSIRHSARRKPTRF